MPEFRIEVYRSGKEADLSIMARGIMEQLDKLKKDPEWMAGFYAWKAERDAKKAEEAQQ